MHRESERKEDVLVSIIVPAYNYGHYLSEALESVFQQEYKNWECLIVNDGSTDNTAEVALSYSERDNRFRYFYQINQGLSSARNTGIQNSKGDYLQFLDSDDKLHPAKIRIQTALMQNNADIDIVYGNSFFFFSENPEMLFSGRGKKFSNKTSSLRQSGRGKEMLSKLLLNNIMEISCALIKKKILEKTGPFNENFKSYEDWEFWIRCALHGCHFFFAPEMGTETYIRCGHVSMLTNKKSLTQHGIRLRQFLKNHLTLKQKIYNYYRLFKLYIRSFLHS